MTRTSLEIHLTIPGTKDGMGFLEPDLRNGPFSEENIYFFKKNE